MGKIWAWTKPVSWVAVLLLTSCGGGAGSPGLASSFSPHSHSSPISQLDTSRLRSLGGTGLGGTLSPSDIARHYNFPANLNGLGQTIAIVDGPGSVRGSAILADLNAFSQLYNLPQCNSANPCFRQIDLSNGAVVSPGSADDWAVEVALDTQWAHAVAPAANILLVTARSSSLNDVMAAITTAAAQPGVVALSMSFGTTEFWQQTTSAYDGVLRAIQQGGIVLLASSGDSGNNGSNQEWPAASPFVTGVGGTTVLRAAFLAPTVQTEQAWIDGGGGASQVEPMPAFQVQTFAGTSFSNLDRTRRAIPDIAYDADPYSSPVAVVAGGVWYGVGGTSVGAPQWAGIVSLIAQQRVNRGATTLPALVAGTSLGFNSLLYQSRLDASGLFDITLGSDNTGRGYCALCNAGRGYDAVTGLGVPNVINLLAFF
jgi:subtilase family serine protease